MRGIIHHELLRSENRKGCENFKNTRRRGDEPENGMTLAGVLATLNAAVTDRRIRQIRRNPSLDTIAKCRLPILCGKQTPICGGYDAPNLLFFGRPVSRVAGLCLRANCDLL